MSKTAPKHAVSYLRVSGLGQVDGDGFHRQRESIQERARMLDLEIVREFRDAGVSGTKALQDRPGLTALVEHAAGNGARTVLVEKADRLARDLIDSEKDQAENLMIVDLLRNDLSRVCRLGSVEVKELAGLESFANVHHLVSEIRGTLFPNRGAVDLLRATFPGGSITGAPVAVPPADRLGAGRSVMAVRRSW